MKTKLLKSISIFATLAILITGCSSQEKVETEPVVKDSQVESLQALLNKKKAEFEKNAPEEITRLFNEGVRQVATSGVLDSALKKGDKAPDFELPNANGEKVKLSELLTEGPVILTWYRGGWCPYCNIQLNAYNDALSNFEAKNGQLVAVSPEIPDSSLSTSERNGLKFEVLSDVGNKVAQKYGVAYTLPVDVATFFEGKIDLAAYNDDKSKVLPLGVTYVIDTDYTIIYSYIDSDYKKRAEPADILAALESLNP